MGPFRDSQALSWLSGPQTLYRLNPPPLIVLNLGAQCTVFGSSLHHW